MNLTDESKHSSAMFWKVLFDLVRESTVPVCVYRERDGFELRPANLIVHGH